MLVAFAGNAPKSCDVVAVLTVVDSIRGRRFLATTDNNRCFNRYLFIFDTACFYVAVNSIMVIKILSLHASFLMPLQS